MRLLGYPFQVASWLVQLYIKGNAMTALSFCRSTLNSSSSRLKTLPLDEVQRLSAELEPVVHWDAATGDKPTTHRAFRDPQANIEIQANLNPDNDQIRWCQIKFKHWTLKWNPYEGLSVVSSPAEELQRCLLVSNSFERSLMAHRHTPLIRLMVKL
jgi:hypothetical protein